MNITKTLTVKIKTSNDKQIQLYHDDVMHRLSLINNNSIDCIITSPPYYKGFDYESNFNSYRQYLEWTRKWLTECKRVLKENGTFYLNLANDVEATTKTYEILNICTDELGFKLHDTIIWYCYNRQPANTNRQLTNQTEFIFMLRHRSGGINLKKSDVMEHYDYCFKTKNVGNVWEIPFNSKSNAKKSFGRKETKSQYGHGGYPLEVPGICLLLSTDENDIILDPFMGTGTTGVVAKEFNRKFIGIDNDKNSYEMSKERIGDLENVQDTSQTTLI